MATGEPAKGQQLWPSAIPYGFVMVGFASAEVRIAEGKPRLFVAIDRTAKFAFADLHAQTGRDDHRTVRAEPGRSRSLHQSSVLADKPVLSDRRGQVIERGVSESSDRHSASAHFANKGLTSVGVVVDGHRAELRQDRQVLQGVQPSRRFDARPAAKLEREDEAIHLAELQPAQRLSDALEHQRRALDVILVPVA